MHEKNSIPGKCNNFKSWQCHNCTIHLVNLSTCILANIPHMLFFKQYHSLHERESFMHWPDGSPFLHNVKLWNNIKTCSPESYTPVYFSPHRLALLLVTSKVSMTNRNKFTTKEKLFIIRNWSIQYCQIERINFYAINYSRQDMFFLTTKTPVLKWYF